MLLTLTMTLIMTVPFNVPEKTPTIQNHAVLPTTSQEILPSAGEEKDGKEFRMLSSANESIKTTDNSIRAEKPFL